MQGATESEWDEYAATWDDDATVQAYADGVVASLVSLGEAVGLDLDGARLCDFGCGTGLLTERLAGRCAQIDAIDTSPAMLDALGTKIDRNEWRHVRPLDQLPSTPQGYDVIVCSSVLAFVDDYAGQVTTLARHLAAGGVFVQWDWELDPDADDPYGLAPAEIRQTLEDAGLVEVAVGVGFEVTVDGEMMRPLMGSGRRPS